MSDAAILAIRNGFRLSNAYIPELTAVSVRDGTSIGGLASGFIRMVPDHVDSLGAPWPGYQSLSDAALAQELASDGQDARFLAADVADEERIRAAGAQSYVSKPISVVKFVAAVQELLPPHVASDEATDRAIATVRELTSDRGLTLLAEARAALALYASRGRGTRCWGGYRLPVQQGPSTRPSGSRRQPARIASVGGR